jgi:hypothetical protein
MRIQAQRASVAVIVWTVLLGVVPAAFAGWYGWDPSVPREHRPGNIYFGSAKDEDGRYLPGVTVVLVTPQVDFVTVTDPTGRFRLEVPKEVNDTDVSPRCSKNGYAVGRVIKRPPRADATTPVELNCLLDRDPPR